MKKKYTHNGTAMIVFIFIMYILFLAYWVTFRNNGLFPAFLLSTAFLLFGILCIYNITITIDNTYISFKLGIGLIKKKYKIANIKYCEPTSRISKRIGVGIKMSITGNVLKYYIVTGFKSIELRFHDNNKLIVCIGTPIPEEISQQIKLLVDRAPLISLD